MQSYLQHGNPTVLACIDARMGEVYWGLFEVTVAEQKERVDADDRFYSVVPLMEEQVSAPDLVLLPEHIATQLISENDEGWSAIGSGLVRLEQFSANLQSRLTRIDNKAEPEASAIVRLAQNLALSGRKGELKDALPSYVRDSVAWNKLPGRE